MFFRFLCHLEHGFVALVSCWRDRTARTASSTAVFRYIMEHFGDEVAKAVGWRQGQGMAKERALIKSLNYILRSERERPVYIIILRLTSSLCGFVTACITLHCPSNDPSLQMNYLPLTRGLPIGFVSHETVGTPLIT